MYSIPAYLKYFVLSALLFLASLTGRADTLTLDHSPGHPVKHSLAPYLLAWEDVPGKMTPDPVLQNGEHFVPLPTLALSAPTSVYWLRTQLNLIAEVNDPHVLSFTHLTFVDAFLYREGRLLWHARAGAFRPQSDIKKSDSRFHLTLPQLPRGHFTLLLRVHHTKGYVPQFDFALQNKDAYIQAAGTRERGDAWAQGAVGIFLLYTLLSWWSSRYRPYLWLGLFIAGVGLYSLCTGRYFIDWFFPENPATGWLFNGPFLHLGLLGFYLLVIDFWQLRQHNPLIHRFGKICIAVLATVSISGFCINYFTGNFNLSNTINLWAFVFPFLFTSALLVRCYQRLNRAQKYLYYGIVLFALTSLFITLSSAFIKEKALLFAPYVSNFTSLAVFLLFSTGLKEALRQHEIDKGTVLEHLTRLQQQQNIILEQKVSERTEALLQSNNLLQEQTALLAQRNYTIETLMNELSHRVKNNLQLLYGLFSLQLPIVTDPKAGQILKGNMARIRAMMIVNQKLDYAADSNPVHLKPLVEELVLHLQNIYDRQKKVNIRVDIAPTIDLHSRQVLSIGLILTELLTNSYKYAFPGHDGPCISILVFCSASGQLTLDYSDNGVGKECAVSAPVSLGLSLVKDLARQLHGTLHHDVEKGWHYVLKIPAEQLLSAGNHKFDGP